MGKSVTQSNQKNQALTNPPMKSSAIMDCDLASALTVKGSNIKYMTSPLTPMNVQVSGAQTAKARSHQQYKTDNLVIKIQATQPALSPVKMGMFIVAPGTNTAYNSQDL